MGGGGGGGDGGAADREAARQKRVKSLQADIRASFFKRGPSTQKELTPATQDSLQTNFGIDPEANGNGTETGLTFDQFKNRRLSNFGIIDAESNSGNSGIAPTDAELRAEFQGSGNFVPGRPATFETIPGVVGNEPTAERLARLNDIENRTREFFIPDFNRDTQEATRELGFSLARRGIFTGSAASDARSRLNDQIRKGEREIGLRVTGARNAAETADDRLMKSLLSEANTDPEAQGVLNSITGSQIINSNQALADAQRGGIENVFANVSTLFKNVQDRNAFNNGSSTQQALSALLGNRQVVDNQDSFSGTLS